MPPFEFLSLTGGIPVKRVFVRDLRQAWYHHGLPGQGDGLLDVARVLRELIDGHDVRRVVMAGNSAGGYAALVFGCLLGADAVLAFAPQTVLDLGTLAEMGDHRWDERLLEIAGEGGWTRRGRTCRAAWSRSGRPTRASPSTSTTRSRSTACTPSAWRGSAACACTASATGRTTSCAPCATAAPSSGCSATPSTPPGRRRDGRADAQLTLGSCGIRASAA